MLGAGLHPGELARLTSCDVQRRGPTTTIAVSGLRGRTVRVLSPYDVALSAVAERSSGYLFRPGAAVRSAKNLIGEVCAALVHDPDEVALVSGRARATFICAHLVAGTALGELCAMAGLEGVESLLRYARHVDGAPQSKAALRAAARGMRRTGRATISDEVVAAALALIERAQVAQWLEAELLARQRRPGRPRHISVKALLCALLLLATDDRPLHLSGATEVLFCRLSAQAQATLGVEGAVVDRRSFLARYRQVRYLFGAVAKVLDPSGLVKNRRLATKEFAARCVAVDEQEMDAARGRLEAFMGALLCASADEFDRGAPRPVLAYGLDATPVPLFSRGPSQRSGLCASDPDGGWYVREGDHREREDHKGRARGRVAWALEATALTTASATPGTLAAFPNLVVGFRPRASGHRSRRHGGARPGRGAGPGVGPRAPRHRPGLFHRVRRELSPPGAGHGLRPRRGLPRRPARAPGQQPRRRHGRGDLVLPVDARGLGQRHHRSAGRAYRRLDVHGTYRGAVDFALGRKSGPDADGYERFMCPATGPRPKVRSALRPTSLSALGKRTTLAPPSDPPALCRQSAITIAPDVGARHAQSLAFGSESWAAHYATLRNTIEGWNGFAKDPAHEALGQSARRRVRGIAAQGILITFLYVAANLRKIDTHHRQMDDQRALEARKRARRRRVSLPDYLPG